MEEGTPLFTIGQLAKRTGLPVRTIRFWSDAGLVPPAGRTSSGRRLYDPECVARLELVATLRELGLGLPEVRRVAGNPATLGEVAATHVEALDVQIRTLRLRRAVLATVARRAAGTREMTLMNKLAKLSATERKHIIDDFVAEVFQGLDPAPGLLAHLRQAPDLPDDPSPEQVDAWVELAELVQDPAFRQRIRQMAEYGAQADGGLPDDDAAATADFVSRVREHADAARSQGITPDSSEAREVVGRIMAGIPAGEPRARLQAQLETFSDARAKRYRQLTGIINGWAQFPVTVPAVEWLTAALRAQA